MNPNKTVVKRALLSVSNKTGLVEFARGLAALNIEIISTGGTSKLLQEAGIPTREVSEVTGFPEMMNGRLKTLHPKIFGGILGLREEHAEAAQEQQIDWIDLVVVNLYPFAETIQNPQASLDTAIENIDIGGPSMIRAAAKNMGWVAVVVDPSDYDHLLQELHPDQTLSFATRRQLAAKAFAHTAHYDSLIYTYLNQDSFPEYLNIALKKHADLRYGENPHQAASAYQLSMQHVGVLAAKQHQGKKLSYNNITDADAAVSCVCEFSEPACVIVKHGNPCGAALADSIEAAFQLAYTADSLSAFGGIVALNRPCDTALAEALASIFFEVIIAPAYTPEALALLAKKNNLRVLEMDVHTASTNKQEWKFIEGGVLVQHKDKNHLTHSDLKIVSKIKPKAEELDSMLFAWRVLKHIKSNAILLAKGQTTLGVGAGQVSRIDAVDLALRKAEQQITDNTVLASDAFFPFRDSIDRIANSGVRAIIQPGGSIKDPEVIQACDEHGLAMVLTEQRCFKH